MGSLCFLLPILHCVCDYDLVYSVLECLTSLELGHLGSCNLDFFTGLRILASTSSTLANTEYTETYQGNLLASLQSISHSISKSFQSTFSISFTQSSFFCHCIDQISFSHSTPPRMCKLIYVLKTR